MDRDSLRAIQAIKDAEGEEQLIEATRLAIAQEFALEVCREAEANMLKTKRVEGAHYAAMQTVFKRWGGDPERLRCVVMQPLAYPQDMGDKQIV